MCQKREHPRLDVRDIQDVAACGNLLRLMDEIDWAILGIKFDSHVHLPKPVTTLRVYEARLVAACNALGWS